MTKIIYHVPFPLDQKAQSASGIRPLKMLDAFKKVGYEVDVIAGNTTERKAAIAQIKDKVSKGEKYKFIYTESSTQPTLHTEPYAFLKHPFFEFNFFKYLKKHNIKIGLFYRDIYWCFPENIDTYKKKLYKLLYQYDLYQYNRLLDILFVPSYEMMDYVKAPQRFKIEELPSGTIINKKQNIRKNNDIIEFIYVGGIGKHYNLTLFLKVIKKFPNMHLTLCCREEDWKKVQNSYIPFLAENIDIVHASGEDLKVLFSEADIGLLFVEPTEYWKFAMPYKLMEFIGFGLPVLSSEGTKNSEFVTDNNCGWSIKYNETTLYKFLYKLDRKAIENLKKEVIDFAPSQTWEARAQQVAKALE